LFSFYKKKYAQYNEVNVIKSITWFNDVVMDDWPVIMKDKNLKWKEVKDRIVKETETYLKDL